MSDVEYVQDNNLQPQSVDVEKLIKEAKKFVKEKYRESKCPIPNEVLPDLHLALTYLASQGVLNTRWQTMDSAPKDGSMFLAYSPSSCLSCYECYWCSKSNKFKEWDKHDANDLTHWMPRPAPPTGGEHE